MTNTSDHLIIMTATDAENSVLSLLGDLVYVLEQRPGSSWIDLATQVLDHHNPPIAPGLLSPWHIGLQLHCRTVLKAMGSADVEAIADGLRAIRALDGIAAHLPEQCPNAELVLAEPDIDLTSI